MERFYRFAKITFCICGENSDMYQEDGILSSFRVDTKEADHTVHLEIVEKLPDADGTCVFMDGHKSIYNDGDVQLFCVRTATGSGSNSYMQIKRQGKYSHVQILRQEIRNCIMPRLVLNVLEVEHHIAQHGGFLLHASFVAWKGQAILFTAPSGTGKSTQAELWHKYRNAEIINGDRAAVTLEENGAIAWGIPYCGTSGIYKNTELPVAAIVYLSQAPVTSIQRITGLQAFRHVWEGCSVNVWNQNDVEKCIQTVMTTVQQVPIYHLACTPDETAVTVLEKVLERGEVQYG